MALLGTVLMGLLLTPTAFRSLGNKITAVSQGMWTGLRAHPRALSLAALIAGIAPLFGFTAIALGLVEYVTTLFKLSRLFTILWARLFLREGDFWQWLFGTGEVLIGGVLVAAEERFAALSRQVHRWRKKPNAHKDSMYQTALISNHHSVIPQQGLSTPSGKSATLNVEVRWE